VSFDVVADGSSGNDGAGGLDGDGAFE
jgi:hypothetical protein